MLSAVHVSFILPTQSVQLDALLSKIDEPHFFPAEMNMENRLGEASGAISGREQLQPLSCSQNARQLCQVESSHQSAHIEIFQATRSRMKLRMNCFLVLASPIWFHLTESEFSTSKQQHKTTKWSNWRDQTRKKGHKNTRTSHISFLSFSGQSSLSQRKQQLTDQQWLQYCPLLAAVQTVTTVWEVWPD